MHVAVIGAGIVGVTTAYELATDGHRVTVFERRSTVAAEASFANAGVIAPAWIAPWAAAGGRATILGGMLRHHAPVRLRGLDTATAAWLWQAWRAGRDRTWHDNRLRMQRLAHYSRERLLRLTQTLQLDYERSEGCLLLLRTQVALDRVASRLAALGESGGRVEALDAAGCRAVEPGLSAETPLAGGLLLADSEVGNCRQFAYLLRQEAERLGVRFRLHTTVQRIECGPDPQVVALHSPPVEAPLRGPAADAPDTVPLAAGPRTRPFDAVVVCAGLGAPALLRPHGLRLPLQAVHGHSITAPLRRHELHPDLGPRSALIDGHHDVTIARLGARVRVAGVTELGGADDRIRPAAIETLHEVLHDWFPGAAQVEQAQRWKGARPTLPDGPPVLGPSGTAGVWLNLGHGAGGWALACGAARLVADQLAGRTPSIDVDGLGIERLAGAPP